MNKQEEIKKRVEATINCLDNVTPVTPQPFFYTRLKARIEKEEQAAGSVWNTLTGFFVKPVVLTVSLTLLIAVNALFFVFFDRDDNNGNSSIADTEQTLFTDNNYIIASNSSFDYETYIMNDNTNK